MTAFIVIVIILVIIGFILFVINDFKKDKIKQEVQEKEIKEKEEKIDGMLNQSITKSAHEFLENYNSLASRRDGSIISMDSPGIYVILNKTKELYYVGQSKTVLKRIRSHLTGKGNGDVYADFKYNDEFEVTIHKCSEWELNEIEKMFIEKYKSSNKFRGYNKTRGNN